MTDVEWINAFIGEDVIAEIGDGFTVYGTLSELALGHLVFTQADLHNQREANSTSEIYAIEAKTIGVRPNRERLCVPLHRLIAISRIADVVT